MRPRTLEEFVGQRHLVGSGKLLRRAIEADRISSLILYGPPGCGKTALAQVIAARTQASVERLNATSAGVAELREAIARAKERARLQGARTILFIDEIHRFNKAQQDVLMPDMESGNPILIGATTFNPFFALLPALTSRSLVCEFRPLSKDDIRAILQRALADPERGLGRRAVQAEDAALDHLAMVCDGDARRALNALEVAVLTTEPGTPPVGGVGEGSAETRSVRPTEPGDPARPIHLTLAVIEESIQKKAVVYDRAGDAHYDTISAFIKSMRGSDPDATLYWLAKMLYAGEEVRFIARRIVICASEDVGNADPQALVLATAAMHASEFVGLPECRIPLAQAAVYVACAPKSNAAYLGIEKAMKDVEEGRALEVPKHLQDASYSGAKKLGRGKNYKYAHDFPDHHVEQEYLPEKRVYYEPTELGFEKTIKARLERLAGKLKG
ncbi:MAG: replication-associated recombination protein A [Candidatus Omnitrophota bacterium]|nr:replication-associated recombination protein A [Candidatus Omnitrophota bacterium]